MQGVLLTALARAADFVLPGASFVEKEASYTNDRAGSRARRASMPRARRGDGRLADSRRRWRSALGVAARLPSAGDVRADIAARYRRAPGIDGARGTGLRPAGRGQHWLQASNPSERWKWDFMFQDLPPVKGTVDPSALPLPPARFR